MAAYGNIEPAVPGLLSGIGYQIETRQAGTDLAFGIPVFALAGEDTKVFPYAPNSATVVFDADFVADNVITFTLNGTALPGVDFNNDQATTMADLVTMFEGQGYDATIDADDADVRTLIVRTPGTTIATLTVAVTGGASQPAGTATLSVESLFMGISVFDQKRPGGYEEGDAMNVLIEERIWVSKLPGTAIVANRPVAVDPTTGYLTAQGGSAVTLQTVRCLENAAADATLVLVEVTGRFQLN